MAICFNDQQIAGYKQWQTKNRQAIYGGSLDLVDLVSAGPLLKKLTAFKGLPIWKFDVQSRENPVVKKTANSGQLKKDA